jgi:hypothetical protein
MIGNTKAVSDLTERPLSDPRQPLPLTTQARTRVIDGIGEARLDFVAPASAGEAVYSCAPHGAMMHGTIRIE